MELPVPEYRRAVAALCLAPIYYFALPVVLLRLGAEPYTVNYLFFAIGALASCALFFPLLRRSFPPLLAAPDRVMRTFAAGAVGHYAGAFVIAFALSLSGISPQNVNNASVQELTRNAPVLMLLFSVAAAPITEECLFRGALFGLLRKKSRVAAYLVTAAAFALIHAAPGLAAGQWQDAYAALLYFAPSVALCYAYEASGTIWTSILLHAAINAVSYVLVFVI